MDPFCGSGTTLAEARAYGLSSVGVDINPVACLISRVRTSTWQPGDEEQLTEHRRALVDSALRSSDVAPEFARIPRLDHWFNDYAQVALSGAVSYAKSLPKGDPWSDRLSAAISAATVRISRQDSDTRYAAVEKPGDQTTVAQSLHRSLDRVANWLRGASPRYEESTRAEVIHGDARDLSAISDGSVALACFSPPYPNAYEYWLYHKYRMYWLGFDAVAVRRDEIGARPHYSRPNGLTENDFAEQMSQVFSSMKRVLHDGAYSVVVVGDSVIGGREIDNGALLTHVAKSCGYSAEYAGERAIHVGKSSFNRAHSRGRRTEHILVFRNAR